MSGFNLQCHIMPEELKEIVTDWMSDPRLYLLGTDAASTEIVCRSGAGVSLKVNALPERLYFALQDFGEPVAPLLSFLPRHEDWLVLTTGARRGDRLEETQLSTQTANKQALRVWRAFARQLERQLRRGAWVHNPRLGTSAFFPNVCYSAGTAKALKAGYLRAVFIGGNELRLTQPK